MSEVRKNYVRVFNLGMANHLVRNGHDIIGVVNDLKNEERKVFLFADTNELHTSMLSYNRK